MDFLLNELKKYGRVRSNTLLSRHTTFCIGGPAKFLIEVEVREKLVGLLNFLSGEAVDFFILGGGSNLLLPDEGFEGVVVKVFLNELRVVDKVVMAEAGVRLGQALDLAVKNSLTGLEWAAGIPGTIGGAVRGNAGAMGQDISKNIQKVEIWQAGEVKVLNRDECGFSYRGSAFKDDRQSVILRVWLALEKGEVRQMLAAVQENLKQREGKFPPYPSAGCFFKNVKLNKWPNDRHDLPPLFVERGAVPAGWLVEQVGARGLEKGGAAVSEKHCNFVINKNNASQADVLAVVEEVKTMVYNKFGVELELEVEIIQ